MFNYLGLNKPALSKQTGKTPDVEQGGLTTKPRGECGSQPMEQGEGWKRPKGTRRQVYDGMGACPGGLKEVCRGSPTGTGSRKLEEQRGAPEVRYRSGRQRE